VDVDLDEVGHPGSYTEVFGVLGGAMGDEHDRSRAWCVDGGRVLGGRTERRVGHPVIESPLVHSEQGRSSPIESPNQERGPYRGTHGRRTMVT